MAKPFKALPGDTMLSIAAKHGFLDYRSLWDEPGNAPLKKVRVNPFSLVPNDEIAIVDLDPKREDKPTNRVNLFTVAIDEALLRIKLLDPNGKPIAGRTCDIKSGKLGPVVDVASQTRVVTDSTGLFEVSVNRLTNGAIVSVLTDDGTRAAFTIRLDVGFLPPVNSLAGQRARLNQLGFYAGFAERDADQLRWAIEEFEHAHQLPPKGKSDNPTFFNKLGHVHGDLLAAESLALPLVVTGPET